jgi:hypothetical protein
MITQPCYILCSNCIYYEISGNFVTCNLYNFDRISPNNGVICSPLDFDCLDYISKEKSGVFDYE